MKKISIAIVLATLLITGCSLKFNVKEEVKKENDGTISKDIIVTVNPEEINKIMFEMGSIVSNLNINNKNYVGDKATINNQIVWYALKTKDGKIFYGQIEGSNSDPILLMNWYVNYSQYLNLENKGEETLKLISGKQLDARHNQYLAIGRNTILY